MIWSTRALTDLRRLDAFLAKKSPNAASRAMNAIVERLQVLDDLPYSGRPAPDIGPTYRELIIPFNTAGYVALYRVDDEIVTVVALRHQREAGY